MISSAGLDEAVVELPVVPLLARDAPARERIAVQLLEPLLLRPLVEVHPELQDQRAVVGERPLELDDLVEARAELGAAQPPLDAIDERPGVPGAQEEADPPLRRQVAPEAPVLRPLALLVRRRAVCPRHQPARIHPFVEQVDDLALARAVHSAEEHDHRRPAGLAQPALSSSSSARSAGTCALYSVLDTLRPNSAASNMRHVRLVPWNSRPAGSRAADRRPARHTAAAGGRRRQSTCSAPSRTSRAASRPSAAPARDPRWR